MGRARAVGSALGLCFFFSGCNQVLPPQAYVEAYEKHAASESLAGEYKVTVLPLTAEYLVARQIDSKRPGQTLGGNTLLSELETFRKAHYVSVQITLQNPTGGPEDLSKDLLNSALTQGEGAFRRRLYFLENQVSAYASLECEEGSIKPISYRFNRGFGFPAVHSFLFLFPREREGKVVSLPDCRFNLMDIGLGSGTLKFPLRAEGRLILKT